MRWLCLRYGIVFALVILSGTLLMDVSHRVQRVERDIRQTDRLIQAEQENIRVLKAEWAYLNDPYRLESLVSHNMELLPPESRHLLSDMTALPEHSGPPSVFVTPDQPMAQDIAYTYMPPRKPNYVQRSAP